MCQPHDPITHVRIIRCAHGTNYVTLGPLTLHLTDEELALLARTIGKLAEREPYLGQLIGSAPCPEDAPTPEDVL